MTTTTIPASSRGRAVETFIGLEGTQGVIPTTGWQRARFYDLTAGMDRPLVNDPKLGVPLANSRDAGRRNRGLPGGSIRRTAPLNVHEVGYYLASGLARSAVTGTVGAYVHEFHGGDPTLSLALLQKYGSADFQADLGCALAEFSIRASKTENTARIDMTFMQLDEFADDEMPAGTVAAALADDDLPDWTWQVLLDDVLIGDALEANLDFNLGVERIQGLSGDAWPTRLHFGEIMASGGFKMYGRAAAIRALADTDGSSKVTLKAVSPDDADLYFQIDYLAAQFSKPQNVVSGPGQMSADFSIESGATAAANAFSIIVGNTKAAY